MISILILIGKSCSGKDTIAKQLISLHNYNRIITFTTRPKRKGEKDGVDYNFISEEDFHQKIDDGFFAEWKSYITTDGIWYYGTALKDLENAEDNSVIILTPQGYRDVLKRFDGKIISIYIYANNSTIKKRLISRGDNKNEAERRLEHDNEDFKGVENEVDRIVYNNEGTRLENVVNKVLELMEEVRNER